MRQFVDRANTHDLLFLRNGANYASLKREGGQSFRVKFTFENTSRPREGKEIEELPLRLAKKTRKATRSSLKTQTRTQVLPIIQKKIIQSPPEADLFEAPEISTFNTPRPDGIWIYALICTSRDERRRACYIGQTNNILRRFSQHLFHRIPGFTSSDLFNWALREQVEVYSVVLSYAIGDRDFSTALEGYWLKLATDAGFETPGVERWGNLPKPMVFPGQPEEWPTRQVRRVAKRIDLLIATGCAPAELYVAPDWLKPIKSLKRPTANNKKKATKPQTTEAGITENQSEWPAYLSYIIRKRYAEGESSKALAKIFSLSEREVIEHLQQSTNAAYKE